VPNAFAGFALLDGSQRNQLTGNTATSNGDVGFVIEASGSNALTRNVGNANGLTGFEIRAGSNGNFLGQNTGRANGSFDASDDQTGAGNDWTDNNFGSTSGL
jgi:parallel beta-helix repeat protein